MNDYHWYKANLGIEQIQLSAGLDENLVVADNNNIYRYFPVQAKNPRWRGILDFINSDVFAIFQDNGWVPRHTFQKHIAGYDVYAIEKCWPLIRAGTTAGTWNGSGGGPHGTRWDEMIPEQILAILCLGCEINAALIDNQSRMLLTDIRPCDFSLRKGIPILLDTGAFDDIQERKDKILHSIIDTVAYYDCASITAYLRNITQPRSAKEWLQISEKIRSVQPAPQQAGVWAQYGVHTESTEVKFIRQEIANIKPKTVLDFCGNNGSFSSKVAPSAHIICIDNCKSALSDGYRSGYKSIDFANIDITRKCEDAPYDAHLMASWVQRFRCEVLLASSILHHMLHMHMSLESIAKLFDKLAEKYMLVEFIKHTDPFTTTWYGPEQNFERLQRALPGWVVINQFTGYEPGPSKDHRTWYTMKRV